MTQNNRIALNVLATYARSLLALVCGLFTARWILMTLGSVDYGLFGVVGGLTAFVSFFNGQLSMAVGRFYAYSVGEAKRPGHEEEGLEECRRWFSTAVMVHTVVPIVLIIIGYPLGEWAVRNYLTIPADRIVPFVWVWRFTCVSCLVGMMSVPYIAMYGAKQEIAEQTIYGIVSTVVNFGFIYYMVSHPGDWVVRYGFWMMLISIVPCAIMSMRALFVYPECKLRKGYLFCWRYLLKILSFSGLRLLNGIGMMLASQGQTIVVNKCLGPNANASMTIGNSLASHSLTLSGAICGSFYPAITNAAGASRFDEMRSLAFRTCKFGSMAVLLFALPLCFEAEEVLRLWLKNPPTLSAELCICVLVTAVLEKMTDGHWMAIFAIGDIAGYQLVVWTTGFMAIFLGWIFIKMGLGIVGVGLALILAKALTLVIRFYFARKVAGMFFLTWAKDILLPLSFSILLSSVGGLTIVAFLDASLLRVGITTIVVDTIFVSFAWLFVLSSSERGVMSSKLKKMFYYG